MMIVLLLLFRVVDRGRQGGGDGIVSVVLIVEEKIVDDGDAFHAHG